MGNTHDFGNSWPLVDGQFQDTALDLNLVDIDTNTVNRERAGNGTIQVCRHESNALSSLGLS
jgi:hypothetical protein